MSAFDKLTSLVQKSTNIASGLDAEKLHDIGGEVCENYKIDRESRKEWEDRAEDAIRLAKQILKPKTFPWPGCANVAFPLLTLASNSVASRLYPEIVRDNSIVKGRVIGPDPDGMKTARKDVVAAHMSYQLLDESQTWESDLDKLLHILPVIGTCFKKVYQDPIKNVPVSELCNSNDIVVNANVTSLLKAERVTHRYLYTKNEVISRIRYNLFRDIDLDAKEAEPSNEFRWDTKLDSPDAPRSSSEDPLWEILEQHCYYDLDGDGYKEPYIVIVHLQSEEVLAIYPRFTVEESVKIDEDGKILCIMPDQYFIDYHFIPSPDGGFYSLGYGHTLYELIQSINTLINQLLDAGTLANTQAGIISTQLNLKGRNLKAQMGELIQADPGPTGKMSDAVELFQFKDPSPVLFQLLGLLIEAVKEIAAINDIMTGQALPQNAPAGSTMELASQGMKPITSIAKRVYRSLSQEFKAIFTLNRKYLTDDQYFYFHDDQMRVAADDYNEKGIDIIPVADPNMSAESLKSQQAQSMLMGMQIPAIQGVLNIPTAVRTIFESFKLPKDLVDKIVMTDEQLQQQQAQQQPDPDQVKNEIDAMKAQNDYDVKIKQIEQKTAELEIKLYEAVKKYEVKLAETDEKQMKMRADAMKKTVDAKQADEKLDIERERNRIMEKGIEAKARSSGD